MIRHLVCRIIKSSLLFQAMLLSVAFAQVDLSKTIYIENRTNADESDILVRDASSGKSASLHLLPLPDQSKSSYGYFRIQLGTTHIQFENLRFSQKGRILYPVISATGGGGISRITLFESEEQRQDFAAQLRRKIENAKTADSKNPSNSKKIVSDKNAGKIVEKSEVAKLADNQTKLDLEAQEAIRRAAQLKAQSEMAEKEKNERKNKAEKLAEEALLHYKNQNYELASKLFSQAVELDPSNDSYYFQYGVALYKLGDYKKSLVILNMADGDLTHKTELTYFKGLDHMKLQEYDSAMDDFKYVVDENDPSMSPTAAFFAGNIAFQKEDFENARPLLEYTLDNGKDADLDKKAEALLEEMDRIEAFREKQKEIFRYTLTTGLSYDQNILNISTSNIATNVDGFRLAYGADLLYRVKYDYLNEFSLNLNLSDTYSTTTSLKADATLQAADPLVLSFAGPYKRQFNYASRAMTWGLTPTFQTITMSIGGGARTQILASSIIKNELTFMQNATLMSNYRIEYTMDNSSLTTTTSADDQSGYRIAVGTTQTRLLDQRGTNTWNTAFDYTINQTNGANYQYNKAALSGGYADRIWTDYDASTKLEYSYQNYANASTARTDSLITLSGNLNREVWKDLNLTYNLQYSVNTSNVSSYAYNKILAGVSLSYSGSKRRP